MSFSEDHSNEATPATYHDEFLAKHADTTFQDSSLVENIKYAEEEITKGGEPYKTNKLTYITLKKKALKRLLAFLVVDNDLTIYDVVVVLNDNRFIKYVQINFLDSSCDEDSKYKPYLRLYREKIFRTEKCKSNKKNMPEYINVSQEVKHMQGGYIDLRKTLFKLVYKMIFNSNPELVDKIEPKPDQFKRRIKFL